LLVFPVSGSTITACNTGCDFVSAQEAIAHAENGDTVKLSGLFEESLTLNKSIIVEGKALLLPVGFKPGITVLADGVLIRNLNITGGYAGVEIINASNVRIENCTFYRNFFGVVLTKIHDVEIVSGIFEVDDIGIRVEKSRSISIESCSFKGRVGVQARQSSSLEVVSSNFENEDTGLLFEDSGGSRIAENDFSSNNAVFMLRSSDNAILNNTAKGNFSKLLMSSGNFFIGNKAGGILSENFYSSGNDYVFENLTLSGNNFILEPLEKKTVDGYIILSDALNITIVPDIYTEEGYVSFESEIPADVRLDISTLGIYRIDDGIEKLSEAYLDGGKIKTNFTTKQSGIYLLAGEKEKLKKPPVHETPRETTPSTQTPSAKWIPGFEVLYVLIALLVVLILGRLRGV
jgi:parallel beta-helix repeat protein